MKCNKKNLKILSVIFLTFLMEKSMADCSSWNIRVFPNTKIISKNSIFVVEGYAMAQSHIKRFNKNKSVYLTSGNDTIQLKVLKTLVGEFQLTQAVLKPISNLITGKQYKLNIDSLGKYEKEEFERNVQSWTVTDTDDKQKPTWIKQPSYDSKKMIFYGCGPAKIVNFCTCISDNSPVLVYTKVKNLENNLSSEYYITPDSSSLELGHGMCSGEFDFKDGLEYEVTFSIMDASGNISNETKPVKFISPTEKDQPKENESKLKCNCPTTELNKEIKNDNSTIWILMALGITVFLLIVYIKRN